MAFDRRMMSKKKNSEWELRGFIEQFDDNSPRE